MLRARLFVLGQIFFLTAPAAMALSLFVAADTGASWAPFLFVLPYMALALLAQWFRCPKCGAKTYSLQRLSDIGYRKYLTPKFIVARCWNCGVSFWRSPDRPVQ